MLKLSIGLIKKQGKSIQHHKLSQYKHYKHENPFKPLKKKKVRFDKCVNNGLIIKK